MKLPVPCFDGNERRGNDKVRFISLLNCYAVVTNWHRANERQELFDHREEQGQRGMGCAVGDSDQCRVVITGGR